MSESPRSPGQVAYDAFSRKFTNHLAWNELPPGTQENWQSGAFAAAETMIPRRLLPPETPGPHLTPEEEAEHRAEVAAWWADIIKPNGILDETAILAELADYSHVLNEVPKVYMAITSGKLSKPNYFADAVIGVYESDVDRLVRDAMLDILVDLYTDFDGDENARRILRTQAAQYGIPDLLEEWQTSTDQMAKAHALMAETQAAS
ncbi:hypothetical protein MF271_18960 (plasmid) [Deinococcus sp. KNUC1210]|uniref:hypothetical protein n=1 Tax=Deinococcus sp. KNUC1210 TaxID=2917691 RepID=UPI001EF11E94|nr:hypothetical protein [Deinococcus sp. KNUC1210]ULH17402.1 hypothetical protein MF271_18960 [Deinococcus sp. KNUC1210]